MTGAVMDARQFAPLVGLSPRTVLDKAKRGEIGCIRDGKIVRFLERHADEYLARHEVAVQPPMQLPARNPRYTR